mgnify:CR=1 FL=1
MLKMLVEKEKRIVEISRLQLIDERTATLQVEKEMRTSFAARMQLKDERGGRRPGQTHSQGAS